MHASVKRVVFASSSGADSISAKIYTPSGEAKGIVQIAHGLSEHIGRYHDFMSYLALHGYIACGNDHIGHGESAASRERIGFLAPSNGFLYLLRDLHKLNTIIRAEAPGKSCFLLGHDMGAMAAVLYASRYASAISGMALSAMPAPGKSNGAAARIAGMIQANKGGMHRSALMDKFLFGSYAGSVKKKRTPYDWLSGDSRAVDDYINDPYCGHVPTISAFIDYLALSSYSADKRLAKCLPESLPVLLFSGGRDPAVDYGKGTLKYYKTLIASGHSASVKLYPKGRHEMLSEVNRLEVYEDFVQWMESCLKDQDRSAL